MIVFVLALIVSFKPVDSGITTNYMFRAFEDQQACEVAEGEALTEANNESTVTGWFVIHDCDTPITIPSKS